MLIEVPDDADEHYIFSKVGGGRVIIEKTGYRKIDLESVKKCQYCEKDFEARRAHAKYCSNNCRQMAHRQKHGLQPNPFERRKEEPEVKADYYNETP